MNNTKNGQKMAPLTIEQAHKLLSDMRIFFQEGSSCPQDFALDIVRDVFKDNQIKDEQGCLFEGNLEIIDSFGIKVIKSNFDYYSESEIPILVILNHIPIRSADWFNSQE